SHQFACLTMMSQLQKMMENETILPEDLPAWFKAECPTSDPAMMRTPPLPLDELLPHMNLTPEQADNLKSSVRVAMKTTRKEDRMPALTESPNSNIGMRSRAQSQLEEETRDGSHDMLTRSMIEGNSQLEFSQLQQQWDMDRQCGSVSENPQSTPTSGYSTERGTPMDGNRSDEECRSRESREASITSSTQSQKKYRKYKPKSEAEKKTQKYMDGRVKNRAAVRKTRERNTLNAAKAKRELEEEREKKRVDQLALTWIIKRFMKRVGEEGTKELALEMSSDELKRFNEIYPTVF
ncbi:hypothetical protein PMAYCL1PPCAC_07695, partial [Pristionchus mayeri]